ncbi:MAG: hypothetical protein OS130_02405 [Thermodesulfobacteriota bacterium]|jgi:hypothetical protein|nr:MAG: hypothetical protein OS130_02405 [Thermodesulfobacteriota bacterium]
MVKITRFPGCKERRRRLNLAEGRVSCQVSSRWLQFPENATALSDGTYLVVNVMTLTPEEKERKICELVLLKEDLLAILEKLPTKE